jgi:hypothetical protein
MVDPKIVSDHEKCAIFVIATYEGVRAQPGREYRGFRMFEMIGVQHRRVFARQLHGLLSDRHPDSIFCCCARRARALAFPKQKVLL